MSSSVLEAIRDWCKGKFQPKGDYLTSVPEEYVTETELESKNYATKDEIISGTSGVTAEEVEGLIGASFLENMSGAKIAQDAEGNWGLLTPGADTVIPFSSGAGGISGNVKQLKYVGTYVTNMPLTNLDITLDDDYKAIVAVMLSWYTKYPSLTLTLEENTISEEFISTTYNSCYMKGKIAIDANVSKKAGDVYTVKYRSYYSSTTAPTFRLLVYGIA